MPPPASGPPSWPPSGTRQARRAVAEQQATARISGARDHAAQTAQEADRSEQEARSDYERAQASAEVAEHAADRARQDAHRLDDDAGLA